MKTFECNETKAYRVTNGEFKGSKILTLSKMWKKKEDKEWQFSKNNVALSVNNEEEIEQALKICRYMVKTLKGMINE